MLRRRGALLVLVVLVLSSDASGKCSFQPYIFGGRARRAVDRAAVDAANILVLLDGQASTRPDVVLSDKRGHFKATAWFDTFVSYSPVSGHRCDRKPTRVEVVISRQGYIESHTSFDLGKLPSRIDGDVQVFDLPDIQMTALKDSGKS